MKIVKRSDAVELGLSRYFTGKPCKRGHACERRTSTNDCVDCSTYRQTLEKAKKMKARHYKENRDAYLDRAAKSYEENREEKIKYACEYSKKNLPRIIERRKKRIDSDPFLALKERIRCLIKESIRSHGTSKKTRTYKILGCTPEEFRSHIESQFHSGMGWDNIGQWHIDHIVPVSSAKSEEDLMSLNHHTNLRPLWAEENLRKSNKMEYLI